MNLFRVALLVFSEILKTYDAQGYMIYNYTFYPSCEFKGFVDFCDLEFSDSVMGLILVALLSKNSVRSGDLRFISLNLGYGDIMFSVSKWL